MKVKQHEMLTGKFFIEVLPEDVFRKYHDQRILRKQKETEEQIGEFYSA